VVEGGRLIVNPADPTWRDVCLRARQSNLVFLAADLEEPIESKQKNMPCFNRIRGGARPLWLAHLRVSPLSPGAGAGSSDFWEFS